MGKARIKLDGDDDSDSVMTMVLIAMMILVIISREADTISTVDVMTPIPINQPSVICFPRLGLLRRLRSLSVVTRRGWRRWSDGWILRRTSWSSPSRRRLDPRPPRSFRRDTRRSWTRYRYLTTFHCLYRYLTTFHYLYRNLTTFHYLYRYTSQPSTTCTETSQPSTTCTDTSQPPLLVQNPHNLPLLDT